MPTAGGFEFHWWICAHPPCTVCLLSPSSVVPAPASARSQCDPNQAIYLNTGKMKSVEQEDRPSDKIWTDPCCRMTSHKRFRCTCTHAAPLWHPHFQRAKDSIHHNSLPWMPLLVMLYLFTIVCTITLILYSAQYFLCKMPKIALFLHETGWPFCILFCYICYLYLVRYRNKWIFKQKE